MMAGIPVLFRTYSVPKNQTFNCTIWEAARATSATPTFFKSIEIGGPGTRQRYIDGGVGLNNPTAQMLLEAESIFPGRRVACIISIGTGQTEMTSISKPSYWQKVIPTGVIKAMVAITTDCETVAQDTARRFQSIPDVYFRFNVDQGMQDISLADWDRLSKVAVHTQQYLKLEEVEQKMGAAVEAIRKRREVVLVSQIGTQLKICANGEVSYFLTTGGMPDLKRKLVTKACPSPTSLFTGRKDILEQLHKCFPISPTSVESAKQRRFVLYGLGGGGKTQVALKFIKECQVEIQQQRYALFHSTYEPSS